MRWPLPALLAWCAAWALYALCRTAGLTSLQAVFAGAALGAAAAWLADSGWRRLFVAGGFPLSFVASGLAADLPAWAWLAALMLLVSLYPRGRWGDAPLFPTPRGALHTLERSAPLRAGARILDAGCGLGAGLRELHAAYPNAQLQGVEWSWPLWLVCAARCRFASIRRADLWAADWSGYDMVYLFQRPESMLRAARKAALEMAPGSWLVSLEFEVPSSSPRAVLRSEGGREVFLYQLPFAQAPARCMPTPCRGVPRPPPEGASNCLRGGRATVAQACITPPLRARSAAPSRP